MSHTKSENYGKGSLVEMLTKDALNKIGFSIDVHFINQGGCDATGTLANISIAVECLNWYGGFIHPTRWDSIVRNLEQSEATYKFCVFFGVKPTNAQYKDAESQGIEVIHYPIQMDIWDEDKVSLTNWLIRRFKLAMGVITDSYSIRAIVNDLIIRFTRLLFRAKAKIKSLSCSTNSCPNSIVFNKKTLDRRLDIRLVKKKLFTFVSRFCLFRSVSGL